MSRRLNKKKPPSDGKFPNGSDGHANGGIVALTPREREVLGWMTEGKRDAEIGQILGTSVRTVNKHVQHILDKLGAETRTAAARIALDAGVDGANGADGLRG